MYAVINSTAGKDVLDLLISCPSIDLHHRDEFGNNLTDFALQLNITQTLFEPEIVSKKRQEGHTCCSFKVNYGLQIASQLGDSFMVQSFLQCRYVDLNDGNEYDNHPL